VEVTINEIEPPKRLPAPQRFVRQALPPLDMLKPEPPINPRFLSEKDQAVKNEMQAKASGLTQNKQNLLADDAGSNEDNSSGSEAKPAGDSLEGPSKKRLHKLGHRLFSQFSTSGEYLPDVAQGPITALNSERFVYYSFFARIEERIRPLWERNVQNAVMRLTPGQQKELVNHDWITGLEVILNSQGEYERTVIQNTSGISGVDRSASAAFQEAAYFPNPPKGMIQSDGKIHLKYAFVVQHASNMWARQSSE